MTLSPFVRVVLFVAAAAAPGEAAEPRPLPARVVWPGFYSTVSVTGVSFSRELKALEGHRVVLQGWALFEPVPPGGLFLTRTPEGRLHPDDEETLPWDAVAVVWRAGREIPPVPRRPTVEGTLRLGNRHVAGETVILTLEDAIPVPSGPEESRKP